MSNPSSASTTVQTSAQSYSQTASFDDLVFQYRNKEYGAYHVRQSYQKNTFLALLIGTSFVLTLLLVPMILSSLTPATAGPVVPRTPTIVIHDLPDPVEVIVKLPNVTPPSNSTVETVIYSEPEVVIDKEVFKNDFPDKNELDTMNVGDKSNPGDKDGKWPGDPKKPKGGGMPEIPKPVDVDKVRTFAEMDADFPGGPDKMLEFLANNIFYTENAKAANVEGIVYVNFTVNKDGTITDIKVKKGLGMGLDEAAVEGVKKMPKWTPARQNGNPTRLSKTIPVKFKLNN